MTEPDFNFNINTAPKPGRSSVVQSLREKDFKQAKTILIVAGVLMTLGQIFFFFNDRSQLDAELEKVFDAEVDKESRRLGQMIVPDPVLKRQLLAQARVEAEKLLYLFHGFSISVAVTLIILGFCVHKAPVPITAIGLVLFIGVNAVFAFIDPLNLWRGLLIKVFVIGGLIKALQAAIAYQREEARAESVSIGTSVDVEPLG